MSKLKLGIIFLILANIIWGAASPIFKWSLTNIEPFTLAFLRFAIAALIFLPFSLNYLKIDKKDLKTFMGLTLTGITLNISFFFIGLKYTASINAPIIASAAPVFIILLSIPLFKEKPKKIKIGGALLGLLGVLFLFLKPILEGGVDFSIIGNFCLVIATLSAIAHLIISKRVIIKYDPITISFYSFALGALTFLPLFIFELVNFGSLGSIDSKGFIGILFGSVFSSAIAYYFFYWSLKYLSASEASLFTYLDPVVAIIIAIPLLGEIPTPAYIIGASLVFLGIYIAEGHLPYHHYTKVKNPPNPLGSGMYT